MVRRHTTTGERARRFALLGTFGAIAALPVVLSGACVALVCFEGDPCSRGATGSGGSATASTTGTTSPTSSTVSTGTGPSTSTSTGMMTSTSSGAMCPDPHNCGGVGIDCLGGACTACICEPVAIDLGGTAGRVAVSGSNVYVPTKAPAAPAIYTVPTTFTPTMAPAVLTAIPDAEGFIAAFVHGVAYSPTTDPHLVLCDTTTAPNCTSTTQAFGSRASGVAFLSNDLYFAVPYDPASSNPSNGIGRYQPFSVPPPAGGGQGLLAFNDNPAGPLDVLRAFKNIIYWTENGGCLRAFPTNGGGQATCIDLQVPLQAADIAVGPLGGTSTTPGVFIAQTTGQELYRANLTVTASAQVGVAVTFNDASGAPIKGAAPIATDSNWLYVSGANSLSVYTFMVGGSPLLTKIPTPGPVIGIDATDPKFVFYTAGQKLFRWAKPKP